MNLSAHKTGPVDAPTPPPVARAGDLVFTGCAGIAATPGTVRAACDAAYGQLRSWLDAADAGPVVRLDHFTESQSWLADRQASRAAHFGRPAALASTGIAALYDPADLLHVAAVAAADRAAVPEVVVSGESFGMPYIATAVRLGKVVFVSGLLGSPHRADQVGDVFDQLDDVLDRCDMSRGHVVRLDCYAASERTLTAIGNALAERFEPAPARLDTIAQFAPGYELEVTAVVAVDGGLRSSAEVAVATGGLDGDERVRAIDDGVASLVAAARAAGIDDGGWARVDVSLTDRRDLEAVQRVLTPLSSRPVVVARKSAPLHSSTLRLAVFGI